MNGCCGEGSKLEGASIALVGNPNIGKSALINRLTGVGAVVSNYPGTTVEILEGVCDFCGKKFRIADLPGIYSLHGKSEDEKAALRYIKSAGLKAIINVIDATKLDRNLFLTLQLLKTGIPVVVALNLHEEALAKGMEVDARKLSRILRIPVVEINALRGTGTEALIKNSLKAMAGAKTKKSRGIFSKFESEAKLHAQASAMASEVISVSNGSAHPHGELLDRLTTSPVSGIIIMFAVLGALLASLFVVGGGLANAIGLLFGTYAAPPLLSAISLVPNAVVQEMLRFMFVDGINAGLQIAIPYVLVFYFVISLLEDSGYLPRMAFLLDKVMHRLGLHGKAVIPMMLGFGCSVPAILSTRVLPNSRDRLLTTTLIMLIPSSARTAVILGAVGVFVGWQYALLVYALILLLIFITALVLGKMLPGERMGFIMEIPPYRVPDAKNVLAKTWLRLSDFMYVAFPFVFIGSGLLGGLKALGLLPFLLQPAEPLIVGWLMLPAAAGITLVFGVLRKELALEMLIVLGGSANLLSFMTPLQIFVFALVAAIYVPCIATIGVLKREFGWKKCIITSLSTIAIAVLLGGIVARAFPALGLLS